MGVNRGAVGAVHYRFSARLVSWWPEFGLSTLCSDHRVSCCLSLCPGSILSPWWHCIPLQLLVIYPHEFLSGYADIPNESPMNICHYVRPIWFTYLLNSILLCLPVCIYPMIIITTIIIGSTPQESNIDMVWKVHHLNYGSFKKISLSGTFPNVENWNHESVAHRLYTQANGS